MASPIQGPTAPKTTKVRDHTSPPTPSVQMAVAFERANGKAVYTPNPPPPRPATAPPRDPVYIELANVEVGTTIQMINLAKKPNASWSNGDDVTALDLTGLDVQNRTAAIYLTLDQMKKMDLDPGDILQLRAVDAAGNASGAVTVKIEPDSYATGAIRERLNRSSFRESRGAVFQMLDGDTGRRKEVIAKTVLDSREPTMVRSQLRVGLDNRFTDKDKEIAQIMVNEFWNMQSFTGFDGFTRENLKAMADSGNYGEPLLGALKTLARDEKRFEKFDSALSGGSPDGSFNSSDLNAIVGHVPGVYLTANGAIEPRASVTVTNQRTGEVFSGTVGDDRGLRVQLNNIEEGDPLFITPTDSEGIVGKTLEVVYASNAKNGMADAPKRPVMPGVIE